MNKWKRKTHPLLRLLTMSAQFIQYENSDSRKPSIRGSLHYAILGSSRGKYYRGLIQPELYRAPEVLFDMGWEASADILSVAILVRASIHITSPYSIHIH